MGSKVKSLFQKLLAEWKGEKTRNVQAVEDLIDELKIEFLGMPFLPTSGAPNDKDLEVLQMQRDVLEIAVAIAVLKKDTAAFTRAISQLKHYYNEVGAIVDKKGESPLKYQMLGLDLMCLLSANMLPEFHMELERIPTQLHSENAYISTPVQLEQYLVEGAYNKIFLSKANVPSPYYTYFVNILLDTVRDQIGQCIEKAYPQVSVKSATRLLFFDGPDAEKQCLAYGTRRKWQRKGENFEFFANQSKLHTEETAVDAVRLAEQNIFYAKQLEMIV